MIKCVHCKNEGKEKEADYILSGFSLCKEHFKERINHIKNVINEVEKGGDIKCLENL
jgi:hypothetical protein